MKGSAMKSLEDQMSVYAAYHQDGRNKATHFIGVPAIIVGILVPMAWARFEVAGIALTLAAIFAAVVLAYYYVLDLSLGVTMTVVIALLLVCRRRDRAAAQGHRGDLVRVVVRRRLDPATGRPRVRRQEACAGGQPVPDLRRADLPRCRGVLRARPQKGPARAGAAPRARNARRRRHRRKGGRLASPSSAARTAARARPPWRGSRRCRRPRARPRGSRSGP